MSYTMMKNCKMNWETESHNFTFCSGGSYLTALDSLGDLIGSLKDLYKHIQEEHGRHSDDIPYEFRVHGDQSRTRIEEML